MSLIGKTVLITGGVRRLGRSLALALAGKGANLILHFSSSSDIAEQTQAEIKSLGVEAYILQADFSDLSQTADVISRAVEFSPLYALINNAAIFEDLQLHETTLGDWNRHMSINLTSPFLLCQGFANSLLPNQEGRIVNILDWRALRPGSSHLPYTVSKAALAALTRSLAASLAPQVTVNGLALGAILPPSDGGDTSHIVDKIPMQRWAKVNEVSDALLFLLDGPTYITGEIIHVDGGRHLI
ncbi:MAG: SDR family oxidoreductase [Anaerolineales bacterium]|nr:SDR family oxidoreductase [Anaerolineales bacterium]